MIEAVGGEGFLESLGSAEVSRPLMRSGIADLKEGSVEVGLVMLRRCSEVVEQQITGWRRLRKRSWREVKSDSEWISFVYGAHKSYEVNWTWNYRMD